MLIDFGHASAVAVTKTTATRVVSEEREGHWVLWDRATGKHLADGEAGVWQEDGIPGFVDLAGDVLAVGTGSSVELRNASDGTLRSTIPIMPGGNITSVGLGPDGSYLWDMLTQSTLRVWSPDGAMKLSAPLSNSVTRTGIHAAADAVHAAETSGASPVVWHVPIDGSARTSDAFTGTFANWFTDGSHYLTLSGGALRVYPVSGAQVQLLFPDAVKAPLGGYGDYFWYTGATDTVVQHIGDAQPSMVSGGPFNPGVVSVFGSEYSGAAVLNADGTKVLDLRSGTVVSRAYINPAYQFPAYLGDWKPFSWSSVDGHWAQNGPGAQTTGGQTVAIGDAFDAPATILGCDSSNVLAATQQGRVALALADGSIRIFDVSGAQPVALAGVQGAGVLSKLAFSADGSILVALGTPDSTHMSTLQAFSMPSGAKMWSQTGFYQAVVLADLTSTKGVFVRCADATIANCSAQVLQASDGTSVGSDIALSTYKDALSAVQKLPTVSIATDGSLVAVSSPQGVKIYQNGSPSGAASQPAIGWLSPTELLIGTNSGGSSTAAPPIVVDATGTTLRTFASANNYDGFRAVDTMHYFALGSVYSSHDGAVTWMNPTSTPRGVWAGSHVVALAGSKVVAEAGPP